MSYKPLEHPLPRTYLGQEDLLLQLAEEASELSAAAAKLVRVIRGENPTPLKYDEALSNLLEEVTDVQVVLGETMSMEDWDRVANLRPVKLNRWIDRLEVMYAADN